MSQDPVQWTSPSPLWAEAAGAQGLALRRGVLRRPALLRFASDTFMEDFLSLMENDPARIGEYIARPETWRGPAADPAPVSKAPAFARTISRLGLAAARERAGGLQRLAVNTGLPATSAALVASTPGAASQGRPLKLYQPAHQRFYLVAACLVCGRAGLPDRAVNTGREERASFVMRRMLPPGGVPNPKQPLPPFDPTTWEEYAFVAADKGSAWRKVRKASPQAADALVEGEELLPFFPVNFTEDDGRRRRVFAGLVPVGKREAYMGAAEQRRQGEPAPANAPKQIDPRMMLVWSQVTEPWKRLVETADAALKMQSGPSPGDPPTEDDPMPLNAKNDSVRRVREQIQTGSWYVLLDFAKLLQAHLPRVWNALIGQPVSPALGAREGRLIAALNSTAVDRTTPAINDNLFASLQNSGVYPASRIAPTLASALRAMNGGTSLDRRTAAQIENGLETVAKSYDRDRPDALWPSFLFPLADPAYGGPLPPAPAGVPTPSGALDRALQRVSNLSDLIEGALPAQSQGETPALSLAARPVLDTREGWFRIRCVFERPQCGPLDPPALSEPTQPFQLAGFFDPDAPARPIRIALPIDTSPAGLRKFDKNTAFMMSDILCGQVQRMKGLTLGDLVRSVLPWPLHKDISAPDGGPCASSDPGLSAGMICSLSIPIITICALLLLMIIVSLLDFIFRWVPFFLICFPLPGFKAKK
jgi:hypothetical protein